MKALATTFGKIRGQKVSPGEMDRPKQFYTHSRQKNTLSRDTVSYPYDLNRLKIPILGYGIGVTGSRV